MNIADEFSRRANFEVYRRLRYFHYKKLSYRREAARYLVLLSTLVSR